MEDLRYLQLSMAQHLFDQKRYAAAAHSLADLLGTEPDNVAVRLLLARAYYHSAQLGRARDELTELVERAPTDDYVRLLLARTLERQGLGAEAATQRRILAALTGDDRHLAQGTAPGPGTAP
ncbi:tetratricopeptide repeat protein [uncultured Arsenicicoccus sp.]|uniref:tetratricopeptide repeat protein n=1 Tax=uncultured Arsenicicoccus sp. TaxID=491339 RepID=UPI0025955225|nr:tetratricopeptide repeat protein [uncultured Arsenicicoccus sp.]